MGAGAVGGYFGARLAHAGLDVHFIARGAHLEAIRTNGLQIRSANGDMRLHPAQATDQPETIGIADYVFITPKLWSLTEAADAIEPVVGPDTAIISFQNGVDAEPYLAERFGANRVLGGVSGIAAVIAQPGVIEHTGAFAELAFGEMNAEKTERVHALETACRSAGFSVRVPESINTAIWQKFLMLVAFSGLTAVSGERAGRLRDDEDARTLLTTVADEVAQVGRAKGVEIPEDASQVALGFLDNMPDNTTSSLANDLARGNRLETTWLQGTVVRFGRELGIPTPATLALYLGLKYRADGTP